MAIKVIVELQAKPNQRAVLKSLLESVAAMQQAMASGAYAPLRELLAAPFRATSSFNCPDRRPVSPPNRE